jgi:NAD(P)-dependent dehydrogenase (short-subunit alcohol dehydrogenase family)
MDASGSSVGATPWCEGHGEEITVRLAGKIALITGAGKVGAIGGTTAERFAREGAAVAVADIDGAGAQEVVDAIVAAGGRAVALEIDLGDPADVQRMVEDTVSAFGGLDVVHNNAAAGGFMDRDGAIGELDLEAFEVSFAVNVRATALATKYAIPHLLARGGGSVINTSSAVGKLPEATRTIYAATKAAIESLTRSTAIQYGKYGIRANAIAPGVTLSSSVISLLPADYVASFERHHVTARLGRPEDIASAAVYLASDEAGFVTGHVLAVDGGLTMHHPMVGDEPHVLVS